MSTELNFGRDVQGKNAYAPQFATDAYTATLASNTEATITVPSNHAVWIMYVKMDPQVACWVSINDTAAVPAGSTFAASSSSLAVGTIEFKRTVYAGDVIHFISSFEDCDIGVEFYQVSYP